LQILAEVQALWVVRVTRLRQRIPQPWTHSVVTVS
jgi:hypothetical protein